jgi:hypothetical protein
LHYRLCYSLLHSLFFPSLALSQFLKVKNNSTEISLVYALYGSHTPRLKYASWISL